MKIKNITGYDNVEVIRKEEDYCVAIPSLRAAKAEIQGKRSGKQEDRLTVSRLKGYQDLSDEQRNKVDIATVQEMQDKYGQAAYQGSTLCSATTWVDKEGFLHARTVNVGDSVAYLVIVDKDKIVTSEQINKDHIHNAESNKEEVSRIRRKGGNVTEVGFGRVLRINGKFALTRSIGDTAYESHYVLHDPEMAEIKIKLKTGQKAFVIVGCDGVSDILKIADISELVFQNKDSSQYIPYIVIKAAFERGSMDNISVAAWLAASGDENVEVIAENPICGTVYDGHGESNGFEVAEALSKNFCTSYEAHINAELNQHYKEEDSPKEDELVTPHYSDYSAACVFTNPDEEYFKCVFPNLEAIGIKKIFLFLDGNDFPLLKYYREQCPQMEFILLDSKTFNNEQEKIDFYKEKYPHQFINLFIGNEDYFFEGSKELASIKSPILDAFTAPFNSKDSSGKMKKTSLKEHLESLNAAIETAHKEIKELTDDYRYYGKHPTEKKSIFTQLHGSLIYFSDTPKVERLNNFYSELKKIDKIILKKPNGKLRSYFYNVISILTVIPAIVRAYKSHKKYGTMKFWQPDSQKTYKAIKRKVHHLKNPKK